MVIIIPCSSSDVLLLPKFAQVLNHLGPYPGTHVVVMPTKEIEQEGNLLAQSLSGSFGTAKVHAVTLNSLGWPLAPSKHFREAAVYAAKHHPNEPWYFFEPDNTPLFKGWLADMERELTNSGKPFMGCVRPTRIFIQNADGSQTPGLGDPHMVGTGIYPGIYATKSVKLTTIDRVMPWVRTPPEPFDVALRDEIVPHCHPTKAIQSNWHTQNYRVEQCRLVCDSTPDTTPENAQNEPWDGIACVIHGCKDGSLADLVLADKIPARRPVSADQAAGSMGTDCPLKTDGAPADAPKKDDLPPIPSYQATKIQTILKGNGKRYTCKALGQQLSLPVKEVEAIIAQAGSGLKVAGIAKWVSLAA